MPQVSTRTYEPGWDLAGSRSVGSDGPVTGAETSARSAIGALAAVTGMALAIPFAILVVGLPIALALRALVEILGAVFPGLK
jgi:hypothetical protein